MAQAGVDADLAGVHDGLHRGGGAVGELVGGVEAAHMPGGVDTQVRSDEGGQLFKLYGIVIETGDEQGRDLQPDAAPLHAPQGVQNGFQAPTALLVVEVVVEGLEVHVGRVHIGDRCFQGIGAHEAVGHPDVFQAGGVGVFGGGVGELEVDGGFGVGVGDTGAVVGFG